MLPRVLVKGSAPSYHTGPSTADGFAIPMTIESLPNELLSNIFGFLDSPQPSASGLLDEPIFDLTSAKNATYKTISLVSKRWRNSILPSLFKHSRFIVDDPKTHPRPFLKDEIQLFLDFVRQKSLENKITSFVLLVQDEKVTNTAEGSRKLNGFASFWQTLFSTVNPAELLIIAPAEALGALTSCHVSLQDRLSFDCPYQYLRLQQPRIEDDKLECSSNSESVHKSSNTVPHHLLDDASDSAEVVPRSEASSSRPPLMEWQFPRAESSALFDIRPWSSLLLNEGSFVKAYSTYEFWLRQPPSILAELLGADEESPEKPYISPTIRQFSYIGIFPMTSHFCSLTKHLPRVDRLYVQLVPTNDILEDPEKMMQVDHEDLWMARNSCYAALMRELFNAPPLLNYRYLEVFESGDAADTDAWNMAVEYVKRANNGWKVAGEGVFIRDPKDLTPEDDGSDDEEGSSLSVNQVAL